MLKLSSKLLTGLKAISNHAAKIDFTMMPEEHQSLVDSIKNIISWYIFHNDKWQVRKNYSKQSHDLLIYRLDMGWEPQVVVSSTTKKIDATTRIQVNRTFVTNDETDAKETATLSFYKDSFTIINEEQVVSSADNFIFMYFVGLLGKINKKSYMEFIKSEKPSDDELIESRMRVVEQFQQNFLVGNNIWEKFKKKV